MKIRKPIWTLNQACPICRQGASLVLLYCPKCEFIVAACDEDGSVFPDPLDLAQTLTATCDAGTNTATRCPHCDAVNEFRTATSDELNAYGLMSNQYS